MRRAQTVARQTGQNIERSMAGVSVRTSQAFAGIRVAASGLGLALGAGFLVQQARSAFEFASSLSETAQQIGVTVEQLQILDLAARQNGASIEGAHRAVAILNRTLGQAQAGLPAAVQSFRALGITPQQLQSFRNAGEALPVVMEAISRFRNEAQQAAAAQRLFGRGAAELLPLLRQGAAGWDAATQAAIRHGLITQEQADKADRGADALAELASVLRVQLAGAVIDALPGLIAIAQAFGAIASAIITVVGWIGTFVREMTRARSINFMDDIRNVAADRQNRAGQGVLGMGVRALNASNRGNNLNLRPTRSGGGGSNNADQIARRRHQAAQELLDADIANLRASVEGTSNLEEINQLQGQIAAIENQKWEAEVRFRQTQKEIDDTHVAALYARKRELVAIEARNRALEYNRQVEEQENERAERQQGYAEDRLRAEADLAQTMEERRRIELELLRIATENRRRALAQQIAQARARGDDGAAAFAQLELDNLPNQTARAERRIRRDTMGPLEAYMLELPRTAAQVREALEGVAVEGLGSISDALVDVVTGARSMGAAFKQVIAGIIADLLRIQIQKAIIGPLANALGGLLGGGGGTLTGHGLGGGIAGARAAGGPVLPGRTYLVGEKGPELLQMGGSGGYVVANDNMGGGAGAVTIHQTFEFQGVAVTHDEFVRGLMATRTATLQAVHQGRRRQG